MFQKTVLSLAVAGVVLGVGFPATVWAAESEVAKVMVQDAAQSLSAPIPNDPKLVQGTLANGLRYMILPNATPEKRVELRLVVKAGARNESDAQNGLAHFAEHMLFNGTEHFPKNTLDDVAKKLGIGLGDGVNAFTAYDRTEYILPIPLDNPDNLNTGMQILSDWAFRATMEDAEIEKERNVIHEEWRLRQLNANSKLWKSIMAQQAKGTHAAKHDVIGDQAIILKGKPQLVKDFYHTWYRPDLMTVVVVGDIDVKQVQTLIEQKFVATKPQGATPAVPVIARPSSNTPRVFIANDVNVQDRSVMMSFVNREDEQGWTRTEQYIAVKKRYMLSNILNERLKQKMREADTVAIADVGVNANSENYIPERRGFWIGAQAAKGQELNALRLMNAAVQSLQTQAISADELKRAADNELAYMDNRYNNRDKTPSNEKLGALAHAANLPHPVPSIEWEYQAIHQWIPKITAEDLMQVARDNLQPAMLDVAMVGAMSKDVTRTAVLKVLNEKLQTASNTGATPITSLLKTPPTAGRIVDTQVDKALGMTTWTLSNGAKVSFKKTDFNGNQVLVNMMADGGLSLADDVAVRKAQWGLGLLEEMGVNGYNRTQLEQYLMGKNVQLGLNMGPNQHELSGSFAPADGELAMQLLYSRLTGLNTDKTAFDKAIARAKVQAQAQNDDAMNVFFNQVRKHIQRDNPRYMGEFADVAALTQTDMSVAQQLEQRAYGNARGMHFTFIGAVDEAKLKAWTEQYIASLPAKDAPNQVVSRPYHLNAAPETFEVKHGKAPSGMVAMIWEQEGQFDSKQQMALEAVGEILRTKLFDQVREQNSAVYGIWAQTMQRNNPINQRELFVGFPCDPARADEIGKIALTALDKAAQAGGINEQDLTNFKKAKTLAFEKGLKDNGYWMGNIVNARMQSVAEDRWLSTPQQLDALSLADVQNMLSALIRNKPMVAVLKPEGK